jgi:uncharacterized membrane protein (DUF441 family)
VEKVAEGPILLTLILIIGIFTGNQVLSAAAAFVLILGLPPLRPALELLCHQGVFLGLLLLTMAVLAPMMAGKFGLTDIMVNLFSPLGIAGIIGGVLSSIMNRRGVTLLRWKPSLAAGVVLGSLISMAFFGGIPVGPVMAAGFTSVLMDLFRILNMW